MAATMSKAVVGFTVKEMAALPFVQRARQTPTDKYSVLSFFFGVDYPADQTSMREGTCIETMKGLWFGGGAEYDALCQPFADAVRNAGTGRLEPSWNDDVDGLAAQMVLTDQLSRNIFRGTKEAFAYEDTSLDVSRKLCQQVLGGDVDGDSVAGEMYLPYIAFVVTAMMHSEDIVDHEKCLELIDHAAKVSPDSLQGWWKGQVHFELEHKEIIDRFGRYPHRNTLKGRESTPDEVAWLSDAEKLPGWAKSQIA